MTQPWYQIEGVERIPSPALLVYPDRIRENVRRILAIAGGVPDRLRPHVKTYKMAEVVRLQIDFGITKFKCATIAEAEMLARAGAGGGPLAYQPVGPNAERLAALATAHPRVAWATIADDAGAIDRLADACAAADSSIDVLLDLNVGMGRTGIAPGPAALDLYRRIAARRTLTPGGLHIYDGHIRDRDLATRTKNAEEAIAPALALKRDLESAGLAVPRLVCGGTPTFPVHVRHRDRECSPGTCILWDQSYTDKFPDLEFLHAAAVLTRVVSKPAPGRACLDLGYKAVASDNPDPRVYFAELPHAKTTNHSEEHLALEAPNADRVQVGDVLYGIPHHVCPTCALYREAIVIENRIATTRWQVTARDRSITI